MKFDIWIFFGFWFLKFVIYLGFCFLFFGVSTPVARLPSVISKEGSDKPKKTGAPPQWPFLLIMLMNASIQRLISKKTHHFV
ncbi:MAG: serine incorporator domain-containing protein, partial [Bacteroidales bacterium]|nr:serine incorporator domain-containing protein [Bacteroidales bacterium]